MSKKDKAVKLSVRMLKEGINIDDALKQKRKVNNIEQKINLTKIFFHIKMKNSSSSLSHLWNQGVTLWTMWLFNDLG